MEGRKESNREGRKPALKMCEHHYMGVRVHTQEQGTLAGSDLASCSYPQLALNFLSCLEFWKLTILCITWPVFFYLDIFMKCVFLLLVSCIQMIYINVWLVSFIHVHLKECNKSKHSSCVEELPTDFLTRTCMLTRHLWFWRQRKMALARHKDPPQHNSKNLIKCNHETQKHLTNVTMISGPPQK